MTNIFSEIFFTGRSLFTWKPNWSTISFFFLHLSHCLPYSEDKDVVSDFF